MTLSGPLDSWPGRKRFLGTLRAVEGDCLILGLDGSQRRADEPDAASVPWSYVRRAHLVYVFEEPVKPGKAKKAGKPEPGRQPGTSRKSGNKVKADKPDPGVE